MDQSFYIGAVGAHQQLRHLNVQGDNIANVNTYGFKANKARFIQLMYRQDIRTAVPIQQRGVGTRMLMTGNDFAQGGAADSGRTLDYMIEGRGYFALQDLDTGEVTYTRNGAFVMAQLQWEGDEVDINGQPVMESGWFLSDGEGRFVLSQDEEIIPVVDSREPLPVGIFDFESYDGMVNINGTRFTPTQKNVRIPGTGVAIQGKVEMSNVDLAESLTKVIEAQRSYGLALKVVQTSDEIETTINNLRN